MPPPPRQDMHFPDSFELRGRYSTAAFTSIAAMDDLYDEYVPIFQVSKVQKC